MKYTFELRKEKITRTGLIPIRLIVYHEKIRIRKSIEAKTLLEDWDNINLTINNPNTKSNDLYHTYSVFNKNISECKEKVESIFSFFEYNKIPFSEKIFNEKFDSDNINIAIDFFEAYDEFIKVSKLTKAEGTIKKYKSEKNFLLGFQQHSKFKLRLDNIDFRFEETFMEYCFNVKETLNNTYAKHIKSLKAFLNWAFERGYHNSLNFKKIKSKEDEIEVIYLTKEELLKLYNHKFQNKAKERAKDLFCFLCFTGQRHSDIYGLQNANWDGEYLNFTVKKTKTINHSVILVQQAKDILKKYKGTIFEPIPRITSQKLNEKIQECCEDIGLTEEVILTRYIGAKRIDQRFRKCDIITSHCGRKTFCCLSLELGISERIVRSISNHKEERNFRRYVKVSQKHQQKELAKWELI